ncbi:MAG: hypothetical protein QOE36_1728 [Gaiellaceae bacterium]|jgi:hypothetical protein|nr:hypothetical protein [Gaiellaceae bacterium]
MRGLRFFVRQMRGTLLVLLAVAAVGAVVIAIGHYSAVGLNQKETFRPGKAQIVSDDAGSLFVSPADHRRINRLVRKFVVDAVARRRPAAAAALVTPDLRAAATPKQWRAGEIPVIPFPADLRLVQPTVSYVYPRRVGLDLILQSRPGARQGGMRFALEVKRFRSRWLVDSIAPVEGFGGPPPSRAKRAADRTETAPVMPSGNTGLAWVVAAAILTPFVLILGTLLTLGVRARLTRRRDPPGALPPPPPRPF